MPDILEQKLPTHFLEINGLPLFTSPQSDLIEMNSAFWKKYTDSLKTSMLDGIRQGIYPDARYETFIGGGVFNMVLGLGKDGHLPRRIYEENAPGLIAQQRALEQSTGRRE